MLATIKVGECRWRRGTFVMKDFLRLMFAPSVSASSLLTDQELQCLYDLGDPAKHLSCSGCKLSLMNPRMMHHSQGPYPSLISYGFRNIMFALRSRIVWWLNKAGYFGIVLWTSTKSREGHEWFVGWNSTFTLIHSAGQISLYHQATTWRKIGYMSEASTVSLIWAWKTFPQSVSLVHT